MFSQKEVSIRIRQGGIATKMKESAKDVRMVELHGIYQVLQMVDIL